MSVVVMRIVTVKVDVLSLRRLTVAVRLWMLTGFAILCLIQLLPVLIASWLLPRLDDDEA